MWAHYNNNKKEQNSRLTNVVEKSDISTREESEIFCEHAMLLS